MRYGLAWKNLETGEVGRGKTMYPSLDDARVAAQAMDDAWPEFAHWVEKVDDAAPERCPMSV
jgi:hypothetical protein